MARTWPWCERAERILVQAVALLVGSILVSVASQVLSRLVGIAFLVWTDEVIRIAVVWLTFLGSAVGIRRNVHFVIDLFVNALPPRASRIARAGISAAVLLVVLILMWTGWQLAVIALGRVYPITRISQTWAFAAVPAGAVLMFVFLIEQWVALPPRSPESFGPAKGPTRTGVSTA
jgi:TRAP-type C4-dicarboxylate transport system permease small subunit